MQFVDEGDQGGIVYVDGISIRLHARHAGRRREDPGVLCAYCASSSCKWGELVEMRWWDVVGEE